MAGLIARRPHKGEVLRQRGSEEAQDARQRARARAVRAEHEHADAGRPL